MSRKELQGLREPEFEASLPATSNGNAVRTAMIANDRVVAVARALQSGALTEAELIEFGVEIGGSFQKGHQLPDGLALAAIAVVLSERYSPSARQFVRQLGQVRHIEFREAASVARACLKSMSDDPWTTSRDFGDSEQVWDRALQELTATFGVERLSDVA